MHTRPTIHRRRAARLAVATFVAFSLVAAACGDDDDDDAVTVDTDATDTDTDTDDTEATAPDTEAEDDVDSGDDADEPEVTAPVVTEPPPPEFDPAFGGRLVVGGESEVANPWLPAVMQCDSFCQMRARTFFDPLVVIDDELNWQPYLAESVTANEDSTAFTIKVREGISFHDGTPLDGAAVFDNLNRNFNSLLIRAAVKDVARASVGVDDLKVEVIDDFTFTIFTGLNGDPDQPIPWPLFPYYLAGQGGLIASPTWLAAVDAEEAPPTDAVGTGPFVFSSYAPGDRLVVTRNADYWITDENGDALPYLDEIEFRVIPDSQVRAQALRSGDVDLISTSDSGVVEDLANDDSFNTVEQNTLTETNYFMLHLTKPALADRDVRCALWQAIDQVDLINVAYGGAAQPANAPFSVGQEGFLTDNGSPQFDPDAARAAIEAWEAANGPLTLNYSTTPTATNLTIAQFIADAWGNIGVEVTIDQIEQSRLINNALFGDPAFDVFGWRNHAGLFLDQQYFWWHSSAASPDGELALNFGRLADPELDALLEQSRSETDPDVRRGLAEEANRRFASECFIIPGSFTRWGVHMDPAVQNLGRSPLPGGDGFMRDGAGFPGQVWLNAVFLAN